VAPTPKRNVWWRRHSQARYWATILLFAAAAVALLTVRSDPSVPAQARNLAEAVGDALVVAVVVALAVEPRLLRYFGEEIATQTFWSSFYSRAPDPYRKAIRELAGEDQFCVAAAWNIKMEWADSQKAILRLTVDYVINRENRGSKPHGLTAGIMMYESAFPGRDADIKKYEMLCPQSCFYADLLHDGLVRKEHSPDGRLLVRPADDHAPPYFEVPSDQRYTQVVQLETYVAASGHLPLAVTTPTLQTTIQLTGTALPDLYLSVLNPAEGSITDAVAQGTGSAMAAKGVIQIGDVFITGQAVLLLWRSAEAASANVA